MHKQVVGYDTGGCLTPGLKGDKNIWYTNQNQWFLLLVLQEVAAWEDNSTQPS